MVTKIGLTGGIGSGKSIVSRLMEMMGVPVYVSDTATKQLMQRDETIRCGLCRMVGDEVYLGNCLNRPLLASYMFGHADRVAAVNALVHPRVREDFRAWVARQEASGHTMIGLESAILLEAGFASEVDKVVMVYAPIEVRLARAMQRDGASEEAIRRRMASQMDDEQKKDRADFVIWNDGLRPLIPQVEGLLAELRTGALS